MKRLIFISSFDYPSRYAHAIHGLYMARAFTKSLGGNFLFFVNAVVDDSLAGIPHRLLFGRFGRRIKKLHLRRILMPFVLRRFFLKNPTWQGSETTLLINDPRLIMLAARVAAAFGVRFTYESHGLLDASLLGELAQSANRVVFVTPFLEEAGLAKEPRLKGKTMVITNAVDLAAFEGVPDNAAKLRHELALPEGFLIGYLGRFMPMGTDKGLTLMIDALADLPPSTRLLLVGGTRDEIPRYESYAKERGLEGRVTLISHVPMDKVPFYEKACDVLAYVPSGGSAFFEKETSPMKVFEYMAAARPIVLSDLPTLRVIVPPDAARFVTPGSRDSFVEAVKEIERDPHAARLRAVKAYAQARENTWERRAARILAP